MATVSYPIGTVLRENSTGETVTVTSGSKYNPSKFTVLSTGSGADSSTSAPPATPTSTPTTTTTPTSAPSTAQLDSIFQNTSLSPEEKQAITAVYTAVANNDQQEAQRLLANLQLGAAYADPILKQQVSMLSDELKRGLQNGAQDQQYQETQLTNQLNDLKTQLENQKANLTLDEQAQLRALERNYQDQLGTVRDTLASQGFTSSSRRQKKEDVMAAAQGDLVQSTQRGFAAQQTDLANRETQAQRDYQLEVQRLQDLTTRNKTTLARNAEQQLGTNGIPNLPELSGIQPVGGITGQTQMDYNNNVSQFIF